MTTGQNSTPRLKRHNGSSSRRDSQATVVTPRSTSSGLIDSESATKKIDSRLDMFFVNGHHGVVAMSPINVRKTIR